MTQHPPKNMRSPKRSASPGASESCSSITGVSDGASFGLPRNKRRREMPKDLLSSSASPAAGSHPYYKKGAVKSASLTLCSHPSSDGCDRMNQMLTSRILQPHWSPCGQNAEPGDKVW
ncbi:hypothetical protein BHE74_00029657 [Ensete ventricosum]|nr:hypothetical protein GW17_00005943 [Ensete ventricosum]RWW63179.1 hypothetical protein BHE74_00029657 [Ensete ventricosum]